MIENVSSLFEARYIIEKSQRITATAIESPPNFYDNIQRPLFEPESTSFNFPDLEVITDPLASNPDCRFFQCDENSIYVLRPLSKKARIVFLAGYEAKWCTKIT